MKYSHTPVQLAILVGNEMAEKGLSLQGLRTKKQANPFPVGHKAIFYLLKKQKIPLRGQIKLIEHFGLEWELLIINHQF